MDSKKLVDKITLEYLSCNRVKKTNNFFNSELVNVEDIKFYRKRVINTTRELLKKITDISYNEYDEQSENIINNSTVQDALNSYLNVLIYAYKQDDIKDIINKQNGFTQEYFYSKKEVEVDIDISNIDIHKIDNTIVKKPSNIKNRYDWSQYCKIEKKVINVEKESIPKINEINLKDPSLRTKGIKNKKSNNNIVV